MCIRDSFYPIHADALINAEHFIEALMASTENMIFEREIADLIPVYARNSSYDLANAGVLYHFIRHEDCFEEEVEEPTLHEEEEPETTILDNWARARIMHKKREISTIVEEKEVNTTFRHERGSILNLSGMSFQSERNKAMTKAKEKSKAFLEEVKDNLDPIPLEFKEPVNEEQAEEEMMRVQKAVEMQRKKEDCLLYTSPSPRDQA
eukprot:TRINITY_DN9389_c0_g1_i7.p1 TRINITY_DN9389_c0_g1~~TRINITY_DN9389_c0_g1_i7.p1  ORF type:complete len:207 (-),score=57.93 TRINITY_DN9389_c0_g1_i7:35-655(-)